jgi:transcriptional regulator with XRE-family HTH domain
MATVGERLRKERESRNLTLDDIASSSGIGRDYLEALENGAIDALPGRAFGKLYIRAYAEIFGVDPQPWIDDYDRERRADAGADEPRPQASTRPRAVEAAIARWKEARAREQAAPEPEPEPESETVEEREPEPEPEPEAVSAPPPPPAPAPPPIEPEVAPASSRRGMIAAVAVLVLGAAAYLVFKPAASPAPAALARPVLTATPIASPTPLPAPAPTPRPAPPSPPPANNGGDVLSVAEFGVGRRVVNSRLEGGSDRFAPGEHVAFRTRVLGGHRGDVIRHVWMVDGKVEQTITLRVGDADWGTYSTKTLGKAGAWTVEARDASGRVLAKAEFICAAQAP